MSAWVLAEKAERLNEPLISVLGTQVRKDLAAKLNEGRAWEQLARSAGVAADLIAGFAGKRSPTLAFLQWWDSTAMSDGRVPTLSTLLDNLHKANLGSTITAVLAPVFKIQGVPSSTGQSAAAPKATAPAATATTAGGSPATAAGKRAEPKKEEPKQQAQPKAAEPKKETPKAADSTKTATKSNTQQPQGATQASKPPTAPPPTTAAPAPAAAAPAQASAPASAAAPSASAGKKKKKKKSKAQSDEALAAATAPALTPEDLEVWHIPFLPSPHFVGREAELARLTASLDRTDHVFGSLCVLGAGDRTRGIGKQELALQYAWSERSTLSGIFWLDVSSSSMAIVTAARIAIALKEPPAALCLSLADLINKVIDLIHFHAGGQACLIIGNVPDEASYKEVQDGLHSFHEDVNDEDLIYVIVVCDFDMVTPRLVEGNVQVVASLDLQDSSELFMRTAFNFPRGRPLNELSAFLNDFPPPDKEALHVLMGHTKLTLRGHPLALQIAGNCIAYTGATLAQFLANYRPIFERSSSEKDLSERVIQSVFEATFSSYTPLARYCMVVLSLPDPNAIFHSFVGDAPFLTESDPFTEDTILFRKTFPTEVLEAEIIRGFKTVRSVSLPRIAGKDQRKVFEATYSLHPLVQSTVRSLEPEKVHLTSYRYIRHISQVAMTTNNRMKEPHYTEELMYFLPHVIAGTFVPELATEHATSIISLTNSASQTMCRQLFSPLFGVLAIGICRSHTTTTDALLQARTIFNRAYCFAKAHKQKEALADALHAFVGAQHVKNGDLVADSGVLLHDILHEVGQHELALKYCKEALEKAVALGAPYTLRLAHLRYDAGTCLIAMEEYAEAEKFFKDAREQYAKLGVYQEAACLTAIGSIRGHEGSLKLAHELFREAQNIFNSRLPDEPHYLIVELLLQRGLAFQHAGNNQRAADTYETALTMAKRLYENDTNTLPVLLAMRRLAYALYALNERTRVVTIAEDAADYENEDMPDFESYVQDRCTGEEMDYLAMHEDLVQLACQEEPGDADSFTMLYTYKTHEIELPAPPSFPKETTTSGANKSSSASASAASATASLCCRLCGKPGTTESLKRCSKCRKVSYCNVECQKKDWSRHKKAECDV